ncbi:MAG: MBL fold metallo-hydrolase [Myxococcales bacterium]|nr:MBL fold metallo-hydrolase [Polyangiaceae bacterium]MDW8249030.1 MBL fold metallo-hydrolase [Myxococcales bacterium]
METASMQPSELSVRFWGVRGSLPTPGPRTVRVGGNTACVEVTTPTTRLILDAGSGLRALGDELVASGQHQETTLLLSHVHWDHVMGLPFFTPLYMPGAKIRFASGYHGKPLREFLHRQMSAPMFPVDLGQVPSLHEFIELWEGRCTALGDITVEICPLNHPDPVYAFRLTHGDRSIVYATDTEHYACVDPRLLRLARGADLLIYDAQYTPEEYAGQDGPARVGWGHSTFQAGIELCQAAHIPALVLFHHDPRRSDDQVEALVRRARDVFPGTCAAVEGDWIRLPAQLTGQQAA